MICKYLAEYEGVCCNGECEECGGDCTIFNSDYEDFEKCEFFEELKDDKEIEETENEITKICRDKVEQCCGNTTCASYIATELYNADYRKADEVRNGTEIWV